MLIENKSSTAIKQLVHQVLAPLFPKLYLSLRMEMALRLKIEP